MVPWSCLVGAGLGAAFQLVVQHEARATHLHAQRGKRREHRAEGTQAESPPKGWSSVWSYLNSGSSTGARRSLLPILTGFECEKDKCKVGE